MGERLLEVCEEMERCTACGCTDHAVLVGIGGEWAHVCLDCLTDAAAMLSAAISERSRVGGERG